MKKLNKLFIILFAIVALTLIFAIKVDATTEESIAFNAEYYLDTYGDLKAVFGNDYTAAYNHFLANGIREGRHASPCFDARYYLDTYGDLKSVFGDNYLLAYDHFITCGIKEGRQASPYIDITYYLNTYGDLKAVFGNNYYAAYNHFVTCGMYEGRQASPCLDVKYYLNTYADLRNVFGNDFASAYKHFLTCGIKEGRSSSPLINIHCYLGSYGDLRSAFGNNYELAYTHYLTFGMREGRHANHHYVTNTTYPTCTDVGKIVNRCIYCGDGNETVAPPKGHTVVIDKAKEPTYTTTGLTEGSHCSVCGTVIVEQKIIPVKNNTVSKIEIVNAPSRTTYSVGESIDTSGIVIKVTMASGTTQNITNGFEFNPGVATKVGTQTVTVSYKGKTTTFTINVVDNNVTGISVDASQAQTTYNYGDTISKTGLVVKAYMQNTERILSENEYIITPEKATEVGNDKIVTVNYAGKTATFKINVNDVVTSISVTTQPTKTSYICGETISKDGMVVQGTTASGNTVTLTADEYDITPDKANLPGNNQPVTVKYKANNSITDKFYIDVVHNEEINRISLYKTEADAENDNPMSDTVDVVLYGENGVQPIIRYWHDYADGTKYRVENISSLPKTFSIIEGADLLDVTETVPYNDDVKATMDGNGNVTSPNITSLKIKSSITASGAGTAKIKLNVGTGEVIVNVNVRKVDVSDFYFGNNDTENENIKANGIEIIESGTPYTQLLIKLVDKETADTVRVKFGDITKTFSDEKEKLLILNNEGKTNTDIGTLKGYLFDGTNYQEESDSISFIDAIGISYGNRFANKDRLSKGIKIKYNDYEFILPVTVK